MKKKLAGLCATLLLATALLVPLGCKADTSSDFANNGFSKLGIFHIAIEDY